MTTQDADGVEGPSIVRACGRRDALRVAGGGLILASAAGCGAWSMPRSAVSAWEGPAADVDPRRRALAYALLAPSAHNRQPWLVDLSQPSRILLFVDTERLLPETDPYGRQIVISHGTFLEVLVLALRREGLVADVELFPEGELRDVRDDRPVARVTLVPGPPEEDPLFRFVMDRRTHRLPFDTSRGVARETVEAIVARVSSPAVQVGATTDAALRDSLRELTKRAWEAEVETPRTALESIRLTRIGASEIAAHRDGIFVVGFTPWLISTLGLASEKSMVDPGSTGHHVMLELGRSQSRTAMGFVWFSTKGNRRADQIATGRAYVRAHLHATSLGLAWHPMTQALEEFAEMRDVRRATFAALGVPDPDAPDASTIQLLARVGYAEAGLHSPRRPLREIVRGG